MATVIDPAFTGAGAREGLEVWRIEKFQPKQLDKQSQGVFYSGDSYVVLSTKISRAGKKHLFVCLFIYLFIYLFVYLFDDLFVCLFTCLFTCLRI